MSEAAPEQSGQRERRRINHRQAEKVLSFMSDLMNGRRDSVVFVLRKGILTEAVTGYEIQPYSPSKALENGAKHCTIK